VRRIPNLPAVIDVRRSVRRPGLDRRPHPLGKAAIPGDSDRPPAPCPTS